MSSWKENRQTVENLIIAVSNKYGGDDPGWLAEYTQEVLIENNTDLGKVICSLKEMLK